MKKSGWYILLARQGFETYLKDQLNKKFKEFSIEEATISEEFSGYIFIRSIKTPNLSDFLNLDNTLRFLCYKDLPQKFSNSEINRLSLQPKKKIKVGFQIGDNVIIKHGDLSDIQGKIVEIGKRIVKIKSTMFHKIVRVKIQDIEFI